MVTSVQPGSCYNSLVQSWSSKLHDIRCKYTNPTHHRERVEEKFTIIICALCFLLIFPFKSKELILTLFFFCCCSFCCCLCCCCLFFVWNRRFLSVIDAINKNCEEGAVVNDPVTGVSTCFCFLQ